MATKEDRLKALELKIAKAKAQIRKLKAPEQRLTRKQNERRKYLVGAYFMSMYDKDENTKEIVNQSMDGYLTKDSDRKLFNLAVKKANES